LLADWGVTELTETEALAFAQALNTEAFMLEDGRIGVPYSDAGPGRPRPLSDV
jgi:hypothetical protein